MDSFQVHLVTDEAAAAALSRPKVARLLAPFMQGPNSLKVASDDLSVSMSALHYWVHRFLDFGVLRVQRVERRAGRAVKFYQAVAKRLIIPPQLVPLSHSTGTEQAWLSKFHAAMEVEAPLLMYEGGLSLELSADGSLNLNRLQHDHRDFDPLDHDRPAVLYTWSESLVLKDTDAKELQRGLWNLLRQYLEQPQPATARRYILLLGMVPARD